MTGEKSYLGDARIVAGQIGAASWKKSRLGIRLTRDDPNAEFQSDRVAYHDDVSN